jgi:hypothetical protein
MLDKGSFDSEPLRVMAFIEQTDVIRKILEHLRLWGARRKPVPRANAPPVTHVAEDVESYHHHPIRLVNNVPALTSLSPSPTASCRHGFHFKFMIDIDTPDHTLSRRTFMNIVVETFHSLLPLVIWQFQLIMDIDPCDFQDTPHIFDIPCHFGTEPVLKGPDLLSGQHRGQCTHHSTAYRTDNMVKGCGMLFFRGEIVKLANSAVDAVINRLSKALDLRLAGRAFLPRDGNS